jgi:outer membrane protein TolC
LRSFLFLLVSIFSLHVVGAETGLTLEEALREGQGHSPALDKLRASESEAAWKPLEALSDNLPKISVSATHFFDLQYQALNVNFGGSPTSFPLVYPRTLYTLGAAWTIFDGMGTLQRYTAAKSQVEAARWEREYGELQTAQDIRLKYFKALAAELLSTVAAQNVTALQDHYQKANLLLKEGVATKFDLLRIKVQLEEAGPEKIAADDNVKIARQTLAQAMGLENDARPLAGKLPEPSAETLAHPMENNVQERGDLRALNQRAEAADHHYQSTLGNWFPKVTLTAQRDFYNNIDATLFDNVRNAYSVGINLSWNFLDGGATLARQRQSIYQRDQIEAIRRAALLRAPVDIDTWKRKYSYNLGLFQARRRAIEMAEESVRLAKLGMEAGTRTNTDVLDAELDLFRAKAGVIRAQVDAVEALMNLELALGRKLGKDQG